MPQLSCFNFLEIPIVTGSKIVMKIVDKIWGGLVGGQVSPSLRSFVISVTTDMVHYDSLFEYKYNSYHGIC